MFIYLLKKNFFFGHAARHVGSYVPLHWKCGVLTTGLLGKSNIMFIFEVLGRTLGVLIPGSGANSVSYRLCDLKQVE